jgi:Undecaprenyl-phosphate glucose phosphotransferase
MLTLVLLLGLVFVLVLGLAFALKVSGQFSRVWAFATFAASAAAMVGVRGVGRLVLRRWARSGRLRRRLAVYGAGRQADAFIDRILAERAPWQDVVGIYDDRQRQRAAGARPVVGGLDDLVTAARDGAVDSVVVALPWSADERVARLINRLRELPVHVFLGADLVAYALPAHQAEVLSGVPVLKVVSAPLAGWRKVMKGLEDRLVAGVLVVCLAPLMALIALAIRLDSPGPVLFVQDRFGFNNRRIPVRKFRTMVHDRPPEEGVPQARRDDPRVTRVGRFLRRTSLDELPQLFNVLDGSMSLVGPRPHAVEHNEKYMALIAGYSARHNVKPGITGWAQVNGLRGETKTVDKMRARVACDIYYVEHWSLWFDLRILLRTLVIAWRQSTAY